MIRKTAVISLLSLLLWTAATANAADFRQRFRREPGQASFSARETTFDLFGSLKVPESDGFTDGDLGLGVGVNYFWSRYFGVGADSRIDEFDWPNHLNLSALGRYPINNWNLAPYGMIGGGRQFHDTAQWTVHFGGGLDYRLNSKTGVFVDIRRTLPDRSQDFTLWRFGVRVGF